MMSPSAMVLINVVDIWPSANSQDPDGLYQATYPGPSRQGVPCSVQPYVVEEVFDEQDRLTRRLNYHVFFANDPGVRPRDRLIWYEFPGQPRTLTVQAVRNEAGRMACFVVRAIEKL